MLQDLRHAFRVLRNSPAFTLVAVLSLALERLAILTQADGGFAALSIPQYRFWKENGTSFASIAGYRCCGDRGLVNGNTREWIKVGVVTTDFLRTLGVAPALGREFTAEEATEGGPQAAMLSTSVWQRHFGRDPNILGRAITLDSTTFTVVGVLPESFWFPSTVEALVPLRPTGNLGDTGMNTQVIARLKPGVAFGQAQAEMGTVSASYPLANGLPARYRGLALESFHSCPFGSTARCWVSRC